jgi:hypothetical protein
MNMHPSGSFSAMDIIVFVVAVFTAGFLLAWAISPALRTWLERPKYNFDSNVRRYDGDLSPEGRKQS